MQRSVSLWTACIAKLKSPRDKNTPLAIRASAESAGLMAAGCQEIASF
jgi:hypothetical protein